MTTAMTTAMTTDITTDMSASRDHDRSAASPSDRRRSSVRIAVLLGVVAFAVYLVFIALLMLKATG